MPLRSPANVRGPMHGVESRQTVTEKVTSMLALTTVERSGRMLSTCVPWAYYWTRDTRACAPRHARLGGLAAALSSRLGCARAALTIARCAMGAAWTCVKGGDGLGAGLAFLSHPSMIPTNESLRRERLFSASSGAPRSVLSWVDKGR